MVTDIYNIIVIYGQYLYICTRF